MILDEQNLFSDKQAITTNSASTNIIDFGKREMAFGTPVELFVQITETFNNATALKIDVQTSANEAFTSPVSLISQTIAVADLKAGAVSTVKFLPKGNLGFMRLYYTLTGETAPTKGKILAGIVDGVQESFHNI